MEHKVLIIGGGCVAVFALGFAVLKAKSKSSNSAQETSSASAADTSFYTGYIPSAVGYSNTATSTATDTTTASVDGNSGTTATGGGFDIGNLLSSFMTGSLTNSAAQIQANTHTTDSAILASVNLGATGGTAAVTHSASGTNVSVNKNYSNIDGIINDAYMRDLGRVADEGGAAFYKNLLLNNGGYSIAQLDKDLTSSTEGQAYANRGK